MNNRRVRYNGNLYKILYDYQNGRYEIQSLNNPDKVLLVAEHEICIL